MFFEISFKAYLQRKIIIKINNQIDQLDWINFYQFFLQNMQSIKSNKSLTIRLVIGQILDSRD